MNGMAGPGPELRASKPKPRRPTTRAKPVPEPIPAPKVGDFPSAALMKRLKAEFGPGKRTDDGKPLGDHPAVVAWLESLEARNRGKS